MINSVNQFEGHVGARLLEFLDTRSPWYRRLWHVGLTLSLREASEAIEAVRAGALSEQSVGSLLNGLQKVVGVDPGAGSADQRRTLQDALRAKPRFNGLDHRLIVLAEQALRPGYLTRIAAAIRGQHSFGPEHVARAIASHMLDLGFSSDFLHRWWLRRLRYAPGLVSLADILEEAAQLVRSEARVFEVLAPVSSPIPFASGAMQFGCLRAPEVSKWLSDNRFGTEGVRQNGGFIFRVSALDPRAASILAGELVNRLLARVAVGSRRELRFLGQLWVSGETAPFPFDLTHRGVWVNAIERENQLYNLQPSGTIDAAIELLSELQVSSPRAAAAGGWAAVEALLSEPNDRGVAADRLAMLVACSFPRSELTRLSYRLPAIDSSLAAQLQNVSENRDRCKIIARALDSNSQIIFQRLQRTDQAAVFRMQWLLRRPHDVLGAIQEHATVAFRRLYRQRNLILHWGKTDAVALRASLRTAAPLVGAGLDRVIHAFYVDHLSPLELVARAKMALATVGSSAGPSCTDLLG